MGRGGHFLKRLFEITEPLYLEGNAGEAGGKMERHVSRDIWNGGFL